MIIVHVEHPENGDSPNTLSNLHLANQIGQDDFKLDGGITLRNTSQVPYAGTLNVKQSLLGADGKEVASVVKDVPVTVPGGKSIDLSSMAIGSIPMKGVDTLKKGYRYRLTVKNGADVVSDTVTGLAFDQTNTVFDALTVPFVEGGGIEVEGDATLAIAAEIKSNDAETAVLNVEIPKKQARANLLKARTAALKAVPAVAVA